MYVRRNSSHLLRPTALYQRYATVISGEWDLNGPPVNIRATEIIFWETWARFWSLWLLPYWPFTSIFYFLHFPFASPTPWSNCDVLVSGTTQYMLFNKISGRISLSSCTIQSLTITIFMRVNSIQTRVIILPPSLVELL